MYGILDLINNLLGQDVYSSQYIIFSGWCSWADTLRPSDDAFTESHTHMEGSLFSIITNLVEVHSVLRKCGLVSIGSLHLCKYLLLGCFKDKGTRHDFWLLENHLKTTHLKYSVSIKKWSKVTHIREAIEL